MDSNSLILFFIVAIVLVGGAILFSHFIAPRSSNPQKSEVYECGIPTTGITWLQFNMDIIYLPFYFSFSMWKLFLYFLGLS